MADISKITDIHGNTYNIKDAAARSSIPTKVSDLTNDRGYIVSPSSPASGAFLVWNGTAWVAQTLSTWAGGSY